MTGCLTQFDRGLKRPNVLVFVKLFAKSRKQEVLNTLWTHDHSSHIVFQIWVYIYFTKHQNKLLIVNWNFDGSKLFRCKKEVKPILKQGRDCEHVISLSTEKFKTVSKQHIYINIYIYIYIYIYSQSKHKKIKNV